MLRASSGFLKDLRRQFRCYLPGPFDEGIAGFDLEVREKLSLVRFGALVRYSFGIFRLDIAEQNHRLVVVFSHVEWLVDQLTGGARP